VAILTRHSIVGFAVGFATCAFVIAGSVFVLGALAYRAASGAAAASLPPPPVPSATPVDFGFAFSDLAGNRHALGDFRGKVVVLNFWATWCGPCRAEMPSLARLHHDFAADPGVAFVCVSDEALETIKGAKIAGIEGLPLFSCDGDRIPRGFHHEVIPATYIIGRDGRVSFSHTGSADWSDGSVVGLIRGLESAAAH